MTTYFEFLMQHPVKQRYHDVRQPTVHRHRDAPTRAELGFGKKRSAEAAKLPEIPDRKLDQTIKALIADGKPVIRTPYWRRCALTATITSGFPLPKTTRER